MSESTRPAQGAATHTPGPWRRRPFLNSHKPSLSIEAENPFGDGPWEIATATGWGGDRHEQSEANASLMAAAPELAEALRDLIADCDDWQVLQEHDSLEAARATLRKAGDA